MFGAQLETRGGIVLENIGGLGERLR
jgi:hypothetical protein